MRLTREEKQGEEAPVCSPTFVFRRMGSLGQLHVHLRDSVTVTHSREHKMRFQCNSGSLTARMSYSGPHAVHCGSLCSTMDLWILA